MLLMMIMMMMIMMMIMVMIMMMIMMLMKMMRIYFSVTQIVGTLVTYAIVLFQFKAPVNDCSQTVNVTMSGGET